jgi:hypothetical protein
VRSNGRFHSGPSSLINERSAIDGFVRALEDGGMEDLKVRKVYEVLPDREAGREGWGLQ